MSSEQLILDGALAPELVRAKARTVPLLAVLVPGLDVVALFGAITLVGRIDLLGMSYALLTALFLNSEGGRNSRIAPRLSDEVGWLVGRLAVPMLAIAVAVGSGPASAGLLSLAPTSAVLLLLGRALAYSLNRIARARGFIRERTLIVGTDAVGMQVASILQQHPEFGLEPVGFIDSTPADDLPLPLLADPQNLEDAVGDYGARRVIVTFCETRGEELVGILRSSERLPVRVHIVPRLYELGAAHSPLTDDLWGIPVIFLRRPAQGPAARFAKRALDVVMALAAMIVAAPVFLAAAVAVRLSSGKPILFRQRRIGQRGQLFELLKFRTMTVNSECDTAWNTENDDRVTAVGRFLRRTSLDELPQLINVIRGEMSLVGPRPERPYFVERFRATVPRYDDRHRVPTGITGWAQIHGRSRDLSAIPERVRFDNHYIEHWSVWTDLVILVRTIKHIVTETGR